MHAVSHGGVIHFLVVCPIISAVNNPIQNQFRKVLNSALLMFYDGWNKVSNCIVVELLKLIPLGLETAI